MKQIYYRKIATLKVLIYGVLIFACTVAHALPGTYS